ncbi:MULTISPECIES: NADH:ubiquinone oxidoreductase subunit NDUFA12 [Marinicauda]|jgi:NADH:ubiquinone oxidoreductase subunit|uniref:NADH:ubiquinone oxidoreductase subunit NDUFA12 n=1 Tax=Marinicauda TaxID=1649466 RepID=UPI0022E8E2F6|nr:NADH:ubiquinone oxidoreductase subunit NDUFA12 [Marinicauda sp. Alg238-R41]
MLFFKRLFAWWDGATLGTLWTISRGGKFVGQDETGNRYFEEAEGKGTGAGKTRRRWVIYKGYADASRVPSDWHGWMHHTFDTPPSETPLPRHAWEKDHQPNMTGTIHAYRPKGSLASARERQRTTADYESWTPEG